MKQYIVTGYDYTDEGALERRMNVRQQHLDGTVQLRASGNYILGGAILDDAGRMIGSAMVMQFDTDEQLEQWKQTEPYIIHKIWKTVDIRPFKVAGTV